MPTSLLTGECSTCSPGTPCPRPRPLPSAAVSSPAGGLSLRQKEGQEVAPWGVAVFRVGKLGEPLGEGLRWKRPSPAECPHPPRDQLPRLTLHKLHDDVDGLFLGADANGNARCWGGCTASGSCRVGGANPGSRLRQGGRVLHSPPQPQEPQGRPGDGENRRQAAEEKDVTRTCDFGWVPEPGPRQATRAPGGLNNTVEGKPCGGPSVLPCAREPVVPRAPQGWVFYHPPCFLQKLGLEVRGSVSRQDFTATRVLSARRRPLSTSPKFP